MVDFDSTCLQCTGICDVASGRSTEQEAVDGAGGGCKGANLTALSVWKSIDFPLFSKINWRIILRAISDQARRWSFG